MLSIPPFSHKQSGNRVAPRRYDSALSSPLDAACACVSQVEKEHAGEGGTAHWNSRGRQPKTGTGSTSGLTGRGFPKVGGGCLEWAQRGSSDSPHCPRGCIRHPALGLYGRGVSVAFTAGDELQTRNGCNPSIPCSYAVVPKMFYSELQTT